MIRRRTAVSKVARSGKLSRPLADQVEVGGRPGLAALVRDGRYQGPCLGPFARAAGRILSVPATHSIAVT